MRNRPIPVALRRERDAEIGVSLGMFRPNVENPAVMDDRPVYMAFLIERGREVVMAVSRTGVGLQDLPVFGNGAGQVALRVQRSGEIEARRDGARIERQCLPAMRGRPIEP